MLWKEARSVAVVQTIYNNGNSGFKSMFCGTTKKLYNRYLYIIRKMTWNKFLALEPSHSTLFMCCMPKFEMNIDAESVFRFIDERREHFGVLNCSELMGFLNYTEFVDIEHKKNCLFEKRIE